MLQPFFTTQYCLPQVNIFLTIRHVPIPEVQPIERLLVEQLGVKGFYHVVARYAQNPGVPDVLSVLGLKGFYHVVARCAQSPCIHDYNQLNAHEANFDLALTTCKA
jgi:K+ transporter